MKKFNVNVPDLMLKTVGDPKRNPRQDEFLQAGTRYVAYGGAKGGGKSFAARFKAILLALTYQGIKILLLRRSLVELRRNHTRELKKIFSKWPSYLVPKYNDDEKTFYFPGGSIIELGYCDSDSDADNYNGNEYDVIIIDEATQMPEDWIKIFDSCVRGINDFPKRLYFTCNPGGVGHSWVKRLFITKNDYKEHEIPEEYTFIKALVWDNEPLFEADSGYKKHLKLYMANHNLKEPTPEAIWYAKNNANYVITLKSQPYPRNKAWLEGDWDVFAGQYFGEFDYNIHTCDPFEIPSYWRRTAALDYGLDMLAVLWIATDEYGNAWVYRELNRPNLAISVAADAIKREAKEEYIEAHYAPPDLWNRGQDTGIPKAETFAINGVPLIKSGKDRESGWFSVKEWIKPIEKTVQSETGGITVVKKPRLIIFRSCKTLIHDLPMLQHDETKVNDVSTEPHEITHAPDALRCWCSHRQLKTLVEEIPPESQWKHEEEKNNEYFEDGEITEDYLTGGYS